MTTRADRIAKRTARATERLAQAKVADRDARDQHRLLIGGLAEKAGLFVWDHVTIAGLFQVLATLRDTPDPVAVLEALLHDGDRALQRCLAPPISCGDGVSP